MPRLCPFNHFLECCPWASLGGVPSYFFYAVGYLYFGGCLAPFFFLLCQGSDQGNCLEFLSTIGVSIGCLRRIFVNILSSHFILLSIKIMLDLLFRLLPLNIKSLDTMTSRKYSRVDVDLGDAMASSKLD